jgi:hypothetical protein
MDINNVSIIALIAVLLTIAGVFIVVRSLRLPKSYFEKERKRAEIRLRLMEQKAEDKEKIDAEANDTKNGAK